MFKRLGGDAKESLEKECIKNQTLKENPGLRKSSVPVTCTSCIRDDSSDGNAKNKDSFYL